MSLSSETVVKPNIHFPTVAMLLAILLVIGAGLFWDSGMQSLTGFSVSDLNLVTLDYNKTFTSTQAFPLDLALPAHQLRVNGMATGRGTLVIRALTQTQSYVLVNKTLSGDTISFSGCGELCLLDLTKKTLIDVEVTGSVQTHLDSITYLYDSTNTAPRIIDNNAHLALRKNQEVNIYLDRLVVDDDHDPLSFAAFTTPEFSVELLKHTLVLTPRFGY